MKAKWFYPLQAKVEAHLKEAYSDHVHNWQDVTRTHVYENYMVTEKSGKLSIVLIVMTHPSRRSAFGSDFVVYHPEE